MPKKAYQRKDFFYRKAKALGRRSRAYFKIEELGKRFKLFKTGTQVIDLGCSPGGWLQYIAQEVGPTGGVIGVDLEGLPPPLPKNASFIKGDIREESTKNRLLSRIGRRVDLLVSDIAPHLSGIKFQDQYKSYELARQAFGLCHLVLKENGDFVAKIFPGEELELFKAELRNAFSKIQVFIPESTRQSSSEVYIVAKGFRNNRASP
ncbi:MAG: RlmE family RNA methyltransferase [Deltaproteobacteria bacterium]|nr:RlmE family RNA methyltransferase [Deltaproteobacteria bacterium]MBI4374053.1 RlmE family RNA methyltransferase [Deltaproteobacteria bacterium]